MTTPTRPEPAEVIGFSSDIAVKFESKLPGVKPVASPVLGAAEEPVLGAADPAVVGAAVGAAVGAVVAGAAVAADEQPARIAATATIAAAVFFVCKSKLLLRGWNCSNRTRASVMRRAGRHSPYSKSLMST